MIRCAKCAGKVMVDLTFTDNRNYETFCLRCGDRKFVGFGHPLYDTIKTYVVKALIA